MSLPEEDPLRDGNTVTATDDFLSNSSNTNVMAQGVADSVVVIVKP